MGLWTALRNAVPDTRRAYPFEIDAKVILPNHIHAVWTLPEGDVDASVTLPAAYMIDIHWHKECRNF